MNPCSAGLTRVALLFGLAAVCFLRGLPAATAIHLPGHPATHNRRVFEEMDSNKDGRLTETEFVNFELRRRFEAADVNKDGRLSRDEFVASVKNEESEQQARAEWKLLNRGKEFVTLDDLVSNAGAAREVSAEFRKLDRESHGYITMNEWTKGNAKGKKAGGSR
jgi:Ca2+-binding EF-hand superfamily protein